MRCTCSSARLRGPVGRVAQGGRPNDESSFLDIAVDVAHRPGGAAECDDNDELLRVASSGAFESCRSLVEASHTFGVPCDQNLRPFGLNLNSIETACPKSCGACRRAGMSASGGGGERPQWHRVGEISRFYADTAEYLLAMETAFLKLQAQPRRALAQISRRDLVLASPRPRFPFHLTSPLQSSRPPFRA